MNFDFEMPKYDLGRLHPLLKGADAVNLAFIGFASVFGVMIITGDFPWSQEA